MAFLDAHPGLGYPAAAGLGLLVGSFLNVVILRLPKRMNGSGSATHAKFWKSRTSTSRRRRASWWNRRTARTASTS